jgi:N-methylhydantoinase A/oxoprolinase/acetone carboxylase beta subunit
VRVGVDTGGTFTDAVTDDGRSVKVPSTAADPAEAVGAAVRALGSAPAALAHGTTVATNALLERTGARVALLTSRGFTDVIEIGRQDRPSLYDLWADRPEPLVPRSLRFEAGDELSLPSDVEALAICLLHSDLEPASERDLASSLAAADVDVTCSVDVSPEFREYERTLTTVINAYLRPTCRDYLLRLSGLAPEVLVMTSAGGLVPLADATALPAALLLSGPAGGVLAAAAVAAANGALDAITFDMGGTSTDVCLVRGTVPEPAPGRLVGGFPIRLPSLDVNTIGAGGGSIARIDAGGALVVGPQSAGAAPGPACYGRGGSEPTGAKGSHRVPPPTRARPHPFVGRASGLGQARRSCGSSGPRRRGRNRRGRHHRCQRQHGAGVAGGVHRAGCESTGPRARRFWRGRTIARVRARRCARHDARHRPGPRRGALRIGHARCAPRP